MEKKSISRKTLTIVLGICIVAAVVAVAGLFGYTYMADHNTLGRNISLGLLTVPHFTDRHTSSGHLYLLRIPGIGVDRRNALIVQMAERGIATNVHFKPLPMMTAYKNMGFDIADFPNAYHQYENEITLPLNTKLSDEDVEYIINNLLEILHE